MPIKLLYKDIKIFLSDKKASLILILMPMILMTILGVAVGGMMKGDISPAKLAVVKKYKKEAVNLEEIFNVKAESLKNVPEIIDSEELFFGKFLDKTEVKKWLTYEIMEENEAKKLYEKGEIDGIIVLGENFYRDLSLSLLGMNKDNIQIELYVDQNNSKGIIVEEILYEFTDVISYISIANKSSMEKLMEKKEYSKIAETMGNNAKIVNEKINGVKNSFEDKEKENSKKVDGLSYYAIGMTAMFMLFGVTSASRTLLKEKQSGTFGRLIVSGVTYGDILIGKYLFAFFLTLYQFLLIIAYGAVVLKVDYGNLGLLLLTLVISSGSLASISLFLLALTIKSDSFSLINMVETVFIQIMALLGGSMIPITNFPEIMQKASNFLINGIFIKTLLKLSSGGNFVDIKNYLFYILLNGLIFLILATITLKTVEVFDVNAKRKI